MRLYDFIFTNQLPLKYYRHIIFWFAWFMYLSCKQVLDFYVVSALGISYGNAYLWLMPIAEIPFEIFYIYFLAYFLMNRYLVKKKRTSTLLLFITSTIGTFVIYYLLQKKGSVNLTHIVLLHFQNSFGLRPLFIYTVFLSIKMMKKYYLKMEEKQQIERKRINVEIQFLKAQVHPHFLFNTLNNIYSFTLEKSPLAGILVTKLTDTLHYMAYECSTEFVLLEKEIKLITDYIDLERVRYGKRLSLQMNIEGEFQNKLIAPLLLIPFLENSFKHGASKMLLKTPWIKLKISIGDHLLFFELSNNLPAKSDITKGKNGIGLKNVKKRLELLFPQKYELKINSVPGIFYVQLKIPLLFDNEINIREALFHEVPDPQTLLYAR